MIGFNTNDKAVHLDKKKDKAISETGSGRQWSEIDKKLVANCRSIKE